MTVIAARRSCSRRRWPFGVCHSGRFIRAVSHAGLAPTLPARPPPKAKDAIEHFVETGGAQFDDADYSKFYDALKAWVHEVCPT